MSDGEARGHIPSSGPQPSSMELIHTPVLLKESVDMLDVKENGVYVDATAGLAGHAAEILSRIGKGGMLVCIDRDENALRISREKLGNGRTCFVKGNFSEMREILSGLNISEADGVLFDLGVSMLQLREGKRGFSFLSGERLDMRMDASQKLTAWEVVNKYPEKELERILREYGEEPFARRIAKAVCIQRKKAAIKTCVELSGIISDVCRRRGKTHPATKTFQALRIEVNKELDELKKGLSSALDSLKSGGRVSVISYHSLEDRIVKNFFRDNARNGLVRLLTVKPAVPGYDEIRRNPSSRSAKLRGAERI